MNPDNKTFEASMARLEQIVRAMERGDVALEESLKLFQEGTELVRICGKLLDDAELTVKKVTADEDGRPQEEDFHSLRPHRLLLTAQIRFQAYRSRS